MTFWFIFNKHHKDKYLGAELCTYSSQLTQKADTLFSILVSDSRNLLSCALWYCCQVHMNASCKGLKCWYQAWHLAFYPPLPYLECGASFALVPGQNYNSAINHPHVTLVQNDACTGKCHHCSFILPTSSSLCPLILMLNQLALWKLNYFSAIQNSIRKDCMTSILV